MGLILQVRRKPEPHWTLYPKHLISSKLLLSSTGRHQRWGKSGLGTVMWPSWEAELRFKADPGLLWEAKKKKCFWLFATLWTVACQASLSMGFSRQEYWKGFQDLGIEPSSPTSPALQADSLPGEPWEKPLMSARQQVFFAFFLNSLRAQ